MKSINKFGLWTNSSKYNLEFIFILMAFEVVLAFSPFGFVVFSNISMTTLDIGVIIAALWGGPIGGLLSGCVFGLCSMWQAAISGVSSIDLLFSPLESGNPAGSIALALGSRALFGLIAGTVFLLIFRFIKKGRAVISIIISIVLERIYAMLVYLFMDLIFHVKGISMWKAFSNLLSPVRLFSFVYIFVILLLTYVIFSRYLSKSYYNEYLECIGIAKSRVWPYPLIGIVYASVVLLILLHSLGRSETVLEISGISLENMDRIRMVQVQIQFVCALSALSFIFVKVISHYRALDTSRFYRSEQEQAVIRDQLRKERNHGQQLAYEAEHDSLTGVLNRSAFSKIIYSETENGKLTGFLLVDIDKFKGVNDTYGHETGDRILIKTAQALRDVFRSNDLIFRMGGDEFAVLLPGYQEGNYQVIKDKIDEINENLYTGTEEIPAVSVSAGFAASSNGYSTDLYRNADVALYKVKQSNRGGCELYSDK